MATKIELEVPQDITSYDTKLIGPFSLRQTICFIPAAGACVAAFVWLPKILPQTICPLIGVLVAVPCILCGWVKIQGLPFEKFVLSAFTSNFLSPSKRKYIIVNEAEEESKPVTYTQVSKKKKTQTKPSPDNVPFK